MWYDSKHVEMVWPHEGYNAIAKEYKQYHAHLDSFYNIEFLRFLPRWLKFSIVDLWAWDWRMFNVLNRIPNVSITACDISENMLNLYPSWAIKKVVDLEEDFPFDDGVFDLAFCFFTLEHINNIDHFFTEVERILTKDGQIFIGHFFQRREFEWSSNKKKFKIQQYKRSSENIQEIAEAAWFNVEIVPLNDNWNHTWDLIVWKK